MPPDFQISDQVRSWAAEKGYTHLEEHFEYFVGYAKANGKKYADWDQAFKNCIRADWGGVAKHGANAAGAHRVARWWSSEALTLAKGKELGLSPRPGESMDDFRGRIKLRLERA